jgi:hypothetical protein
MYNTKFICTYNYYDPALNENHSKMEDVQGLEDMADLLYQAELVQVFGETIYNEEIMNKKIYKLYSILSVNDKIKECMKTASEKFMGQPHLELGLIILFSYDTFFVLHKCVCEFIETNNISDENINTLKKAIK